MKEWKLSRMKPRKLIYFWKSKRDNMAWGRWYKLWSFYNKINLQTLFLGFMLSWIEAAHTSTTTTIRIVSLQSTSMYYKEDVNSIDVLFVLASLSDNEVLRKQEVVVILEFLHILLIAENEFCCCIKVTQKAFSRAKKKKKSLCVKNKFHFLRKKKHSLHFHKRNISRRINNSYFHIAYSHIAAASSKLITFRLEIAQNAKMFSNLRKASRCIKGIAFEMFTNWQ